jgi:NTP pyrophosphatase (non-canonical NTP hydrolase)
MIEFTEEKMEIMYQSIVHFGVVNQMFKTIEELGELQQAICKFNTEEGVQSFENMVEEIADSLIMIKKLMIIFSIKEKEIEDIQDFKLKRLVNKMKGKPI